ncbi:hypothetical protein KSF_023500 [Reticulibacter mediterranei]|uniref:NACHT domain-containing protein n=1 Tax=Reticulibacter mediterranei TaxID=2778369 RepID=A0A8J3MZV6_9CHLR|nr:NACHT domain-containing protein [Reticulibacter mediterranei]GHO92302.1 hypothetical protein KSF_023500 [Reticulibacter mediterranei]
MDIDPNTLSVLLGVLTNALTSLIAITGKEAGKQLIGKDFLQKWEQEKTALEPILRNAVCTVANDVSWEDEGEEIIALFLRSPEVEEIVRQIYATYVLFSNNEYQESQQTLQQIFAILFTRFITDYPASIALTPEKTTEAANYLFEALLKSCNVALRVATEQGILAAHEALSVFRHNVLHSEVASIQKKLDFFISQQSLDMPAIYDFEKRYRMQVSQRHGYIKPPNFDSARQLPIDDLYVSPNFAVVSSKRQDVENERLTFQAFLTGIYRAVLLGNPGGGKSTFTLKVCHDIAAYYSERLFAGREQLTPILVVLRNYGAEKKEHRCSIREYIETEVEATYQLPPAPDGALEYLLVNGSALVIFDGLDELLETSYRQEIRDDVQSFCNLYPAVPVLVTSREVGYEQAPLDEHLFEVFRLDSFNNEQVNEYVQKWFAAADVGVTQKEQQQKIDAFLEESENLTDLRSNPLMLALMCNIYRGENYLPRNRPDVYDKCATMLFERWDKSRNIRVALPFETHIRPTMMYLASWIYADEGLRSGVSERRLIAKAAEYLQRKRFDDPDEAERAAREFIEFCRGRAWVFTDTGTEKDGESLYQFTHQTFLEYFTAWYLVRNHSTPAALLTVLAPRIAKREWDVVSQLAFQILNRNSENAGDKLLSALIKRAGKAKGNAYWNLLSFAIRCLGFMVPAPEVTREIITACMRSVVVEGTLQMENDRESKRRFVGNDILREVRLIAYENQTIVINAIYRLFMQVLEGKDQIKMCVILEICQSLEQGAPEEWGKLVENILDLCSDKLELVLSHSLFLCYYMLWNEKINIDKLIQLHGINSLFTKTITGVYGMIIYISIMDAVMNYILYTIYDEFDVEGKRIATDILKRLGSVFISSLPINFMNLYHAVQDQARKWVNLSPLENDNVMWIVDADALWGLFTTFALLLELCNSSDLPPILNVIKQAPHPFYNLIHYIFLARFESIPAEEVQAEMDARGFSSEQQQFIRQWVRHEKNFIEWQQEEQDVSEG